MATVLARTNRQGEGRGAIAYNLAGVALLALLMAVGLAYLIDTAGRMSGPAAPKLQDENTIVQTIGGRELSIPESWFRYGEQIKAGFVGQADLNFQLQLAEGQPALSANVTLLPRGRARASSTMLDSVYLHLFDEGSVGGVPGLVGKRLVGKEGYAGETVWYDPLAPNPFVAKCMDAVSAEAPATCLRTVHLPSGLAAVIAFDAGALPSWRQFDAELALWLDRIGAL